MITLNKYYHNVLSEVVNLIEKKLGGNMENLIGKEGYVGAAGGILRTQVYLMKRPAIAGVTKVTEDFIILPLNTKVKVIEVPQDDKTN